MSVDVKIAGASYTGVPAILIPLSDGTGNARFCDVSGTTATASDVASGKTFYASDGTLTTGTNTGTGSGGTSLPSGVTQLDSVSLSNQYIDTGVTPEPNYTYQIDFSTTNSPSAACATFGCRISDRNSKCFCLTQLTPKGNVRFDFDNIPADSSTYQKYTAYIGDNLQTHIYFDGQQGNIWFSNESDGEAYTKPAISPSSSSKLTASIYLGACHQQNTNSAILMTNSIKFYSCKIMNIFGHKMIYEFIPASYNGKNGMYETVNSRFHGVDGSISDVG